MYKVAIKNAEEFKEVQSIFFNCGIFWIASTHTYLNYYSEYTFIRITIHKGSVVLVLMDEDDEITYENTKELYQDQLDDIDIPSLLFDALL